MLRPTTAIETLELIQQDTWMMEVLAAVREMHLPDAWVGAGFVRARVWDALHGFASPTPLDDVDVIYLDPADTDEAREKAYDAELHTLLPQVPWSSKNQARMHLMKGHAAYTSSTEALANWTETATAVAVRLLSDTRLELTAPHGVDDLLAGIIRPTPHGRTVLDVFRGRVASKRWMEKWPHLRVDEAVPDPVPEPVRIVR